ncbi:hypothetical protein [Mycolicibacterium hodleri]|nr:hypothetical protein [Mycolicibacterium hodleri]
MNALRPDALATARPVTLETQAHRIGRRFWPYIQDPPTDIRSAV